MADAATVAGILPPASLAHRRHREAPRRECRGIFVREYPSQKSRAGFLEPYHEKEEELSTTPPSQKIPSRNRGVYFGPVYSRDRNKRHICISLGLSASSLVIQASGKIPVIARLCDRKSPKG